MHHDWLEVPTLGDLLVRGAGKWPEKDALIVGEARYSYRGLLEAAERSARSLLGIGVRPRERVGILMPTCADVFETLLGCWLADIPAVVINARFKTRELTHVLHDSEPVAVVTTDLIEEHVDFVELLRESTADRPPALRDLVLLGESSPAGFVDRAAFVAAGADVPVDEVHRLRRRAQLRREATMLYTSGTTANPKGCPLTNESLVRTGMSAAERWALTEDDRFWNPLPIYHMGVIFPLIAHLHSGATNVAMERFEPAAAIEQIERERCTYIFPTFPTIVQPLLHHPDFARLDQRRIRLVLDTGAPESIRNTQEHFPHASVITLYGMTETSGGVAFGHHDDPLEQRIATGGRPFRGTEVRIVDPETGADLPAGERGEILVRGPGLFDGYHNDPIRTAEAFVGGWFRTGDLGAVDEDGRVSYLGRSKDMLKVGGENVAAMEVEAYLQTHPAVKVAAVVGVPDEKYLEVPAAFVELAEGRTTSEEELVAYCRGQIASFKVPRYVRFVDEWPMSASKIQKFRLRDSLLDELGAVASS
jgi:acyl-CoA synthetase (AMP-forming)/AMP-acid ligase II